MCRILEERTLRWERILWHVWSVVKHQPSDNERGQCVSVPMCVNDHVTHGILTTKEVNLQVTLLYVLMEKSHLPVYWVY